MLKKRIMSLLLVIAMVTSLFPGIHAAAEDTVQIGNWEQFIVDIVFVVVVVELLAQRLNLYQNIVLLYHILYSQRTKVHILFQIERKIKKKRKKIC